MEQYDNGGGDEPSGGWYWPNVYAQNASLIQAIMTRPPWGSTEPNQLGGAEQDCGIWRMDANDLRDQSCAKSVEHICAFGDVLSLLINIYLTHFYIITNSR